MSNLPSTKPVKSITLTLNSVILAFTILIMFAMAGTIVFLIQDRSNMTVPDSYGSPRDNGYSQEKYQSPYDKSDGYQNDTSYQQPTDSDCVSYDGDYTNDTCSN